MLIRNPVSSRQRARRINRTLAQEHVDAPADASSFDEEALSPPDQEAAYADGGSLADDGYAASSDEQEGAYPAEAYDEADNEQASDAEEAADEDQWVGDDWPGEAHEHEESRALVPAEGHYEVTRVLDPGPSMPVFITGKYQAVKPGVLGHQPHSLRARRPRPFFMHTMVVAVSLLGVLATLVAIVPLSKGGQLAQALNSLASFSAPSSGNVTPFHPYIVHYDDTLQTIADKFQVAAGGILELNDLVSADQLFIGMRLKIPNDPAYGSTYHALLDIPLAPTITPSPPYAFFIAPPGFESFSVQDFYGDPWGGSFGQCTWWASHKRPDHNYLGMGDAWAWLYAAPQRGYTVTTTPTANATVVFEPGVESASGIGHVAHVEQVLGNGWVLISEMNFFWNNGGWGRVDYRYITAGPGVYFII
jgi:LysM repeat protein